MYSELSRLIVSFCWLPDISMFLDARLSQPRKLFPLPAIFFCCLSSIIFLCLSPFNSSRREAHYCRCQISHAMAYQSCWAILWKSTLIGFDVSTLLHIQLSESDDSSCISQERCKLRMDVPLPDVYCQFARNTVFLHRINTPILGGTWPIEQRIAPCTRLILYWTSYHTASTERTKMSVMN